MTPKQIEHRELVRQLRALRADEIRLRHRLRNLWLTMTRDERAGLTDPPLVGVSLVREARSN